MIDDAPLTIARIAFEKAGVPAIALLSDRFTWACPEMPAIAAFLNVAFRVHDAGPANGVPGMTEAAAAAEWLKGKLAIEPTEDAPAGVAF